MKYGILNQKHQDYDEVKLQKRKLLYRGGEELLKKAELFIPREPIESAKTYKARLKSACYENYFAQITNDYTSSVFDKQFTVLPAADASDASTPGTELLDSEPFWREFAADVDLMGHSLSAFMAHQLTDGQKYDHAFTAVDFQEPPTGLPEEVSRLQEKELKLNRGYLVEVPVSAVINWATDDFGNYKFMVLKNEQIVQDTFESKPYKLIQFKIWKNENKRISYQVWQIKTDLEKEPGSGDECLPVTPETVVDYPRIPIFKLCLPHPLRTGTLIANLVVDHFNLNSAITYALNRNLFSLFVIKLGSELPSNDMEINETQSDAGRGQRALQELKEKVGIILGSDDSAEFVEPTGSIYELAQNRLKDKVNNIHQVVNQMGFSMNGQKQAISAMAKSIDKHSKQLVVQHYANIVSAHTLEIYNFIAQVRKDEVAWQIVGLDNYQQYDNAEVLAESQMVMDIKIPSKTFKKRHLTDVAFKLESNLDPATRITIQNEISEYVDNTDIEKLMTSEPPPEAEKELNETEKE